jgi:nucleoside 2-deoxyribosyltransferase
MRVVGGVYSEYCYHPAWHQLFGSGGRGAAALTRLGVTNVTLTTCIPDTAAKSIYATLLPFGIEIDRVQTDPYYEFRYTHPLSEPLLVPAPKRVEYQKVVDGEIVLAYGMLEGLPKVEAECLVYDPQSESDPVLPEAFASGVERLAIVLNERELARLSEHADPIKAGQTLLAKTKAAAVILKTGPYGCAVIEPNGVTSVPVFPTRNVFKIGSGDIFSAAFTKFWAVDRLSPLEAAQRASLRTALYCQTRSLDAIAEPDEATLFPQTRRVQPVAYLAGPFFSLAQRILVEEARRSLISLGARVFSPLHEVGTDFDPQTIAHEDLKGLEDSTVILALIPDLDPGTIFEIGFARARNIPVVAYGEGIKSEHLTMLIGSGCICIGDFCSALYNAIWQGMR